MPAEHEIRYLPAAQNDLLEIRDYISADSPARAEAFIDRLDQGIGRLAALPLLGRQPRPFWLRKKGYRILILDDYLAFYRLKAERVVVHRVLHGSIKYEGLL